MILVLAFRNLFRNWGRTGLSMLMISGGVAAVVIFNGFTDAILEDIRWGAVNHQFGHIQIAKKAFWFPGSDDLFQDRQIDDIGFFRKLVKDIPGVEIVAGRQFTYGLVSTGEDSVAAQIIGYEPHQERGILSGSMIVEGNVLSGSDDESKEQSITFYSAIGEGLASKLKVKPGQTLTLIGQTSDGAINAVDTEVKMVFRTLIQEIDDTTVYVSLNTSQRLLDSESVERIVVKLKDHTMVDQVIELVKKAIPTEVIARSWREMARLYNQTESYFKTQNAVVSVIILILILLAITSTVSMAVSERVGEIGTMRAIGGTRRGVLIHFATEGVILGVIGGVLGMLLGFAISTIITWAEMPITLPGSTQPIPVRINLVAKAYFEAFLITVFATLSATLLAARRAVRMRIVDALKYNV